MKQTCAVPDHLGDFRITSYVITLMTPFDNSAICQAAFDTRL